MNKVYGGIPTPPELIEIEHELMTLEILPSTGDAQRVLDRRGREFDRNFIRAWLSQIADEE